jgi:hypothetical protein
MRGIPLPVTAAFEHFLPRSPDLITPPGFFFLALLLRTEQTPSKRQLGKVLSELILEKPGRHFATTCQSFSF